jgi:hypothetical protein
MDTQQYEYRYEKEPSDAQFKDAMRYRKLKFFVDTLVIMDKNKGALHFETYEELDAYIDTLKVSNGPLTARDITAHALSILEDQLTMTTKESRK